jgi:hypothetical protein
MLGLSDSDAGPLQSRPDAAPANARIDDIVRRIDAGELTPAPANIALLADR